MFVDVHTVEHFLFDCDSHKELSTQLKSSAISRNLIVSAKLALSVEPFLDIIYRYICTNKISI